MDCRDRFKDTASLILAPFEVLMHCPWLRQALLANDATKPLKAGISNCINQPAHLLLQFKILGAPSSDRQIAKVQPLAKFARGSACCPPRLRARARKCDGSRYCLLLADCPGCCPS
jgi:hypothetical protein